MRTFESTMVSRNRASLALAFVALSAASGMAQTPTTAPAGDSPARARDPLATKQQIVRDRMTQLEDRMFRLTEKLSAAEPEQARKLEAAMKRAQELLIRRNMDDAVQLLENNRLTDAAERQVAAVKGLENVLKILLEEGDNTKERQREIDRLQAYREQVQRLLDHERQLKAQTDAAPRLTALLAAVRAAITRLESLIDEQRKATDATSAAAQGGKPGDAGKLGESQKSIREETQDVGKMLEKPDGQADRQEGRSGTSPEETPATDQKAATRPEPGRSGDQNAGKVSERKDDAPKDEAAIEAGVRNAREDVNQAAGQMQAAEEALGRQAVPQAVPMQKKATESLRRALQELKRQEQETRRQLDQAQAAKRQRELQQQAQGTAEQMKSGQSPPEGGKSGERKDGQQQGNQQQGDQQKDGQQQGGQKSDRPQQPVPGNQNVEQAGQHMQKAADELDKDKPQQAGPEQQKAVEQLEQARRELEQALDQLRREQQEEILRGLESRFRAMLAQQLIINEGTLGLDKMGRDAWAHADELKLAGLAQDQSAVADQAGQALNLLKEEGTTVVFPRIVEQMREDMSQVVALLNQKKTGARTQRIQSDVVTTLKELVEAIRELCKKIQDGEAGSGNQAQSQTPPLLPGSAELKLLRSCQERVNRQTSGFDEEHSDRAALDAEGRGQLDQIARRQQEIAEMARKMNERITGQ